MVDESVISETPEEHKMHIDPVGFIAEIINNIGDQRDAIRELLSNSSSREVGAKKIEVRIYDSEKGLSFTISDDGCGMNYTKDVKKPGRLDKFLNAAQGKQAGFESDEFGAKGLGTKLLYNSDEVEILTWDGGEYVYRVLISEPYKNLDENKELTKPLVSAIPANRYPMKKKGTSITVKGWAGFHATPREWKIDKMERYLRYFTVVGYTRLQTRDLPLPEFVLYVAGEMKKMQPGFFYIVEDDKAEDPKSVVFGPIIIEKKTQSGKNVKLILKGGITIETSKFQLTEERGGVWLSLKGIPYFKLPTNKYSRKLNMTDDFIRFVAECDDVTLNLDRSAFRDDENYYVFQEALDEAFSKIREDSKFEKYYKNRKRELSIELQAFMNEKKKEFSSEDKSYVWYEDKMLLAEPESENDTGALLWILEGRGLLPFAKFKTLQYVGYSKGIDMLVDFQEEKDKEEKNCIYAELERVFSNLIKHKHDPGQMSLAFCWQVDKGKVNIGTITKTAKPYKYMYSLGDTTIPVFEISSFPGIFVGTRREAKEHFEDKKY
jgi:hypothetical protein